MKTKTEYEMGVYVEKELLIKVFKGTDKKALIKEADEYMDTIIELNKDTDTDIGINIGIKTHYYA